MYFENKNNHFRYCVGLIALRACNIVSYALQPGCIQKNVWPWSLNIALDIPNVFSIDVLISLFLFCNCSYVGAVLLASMQGLTVNIDPVLYTWLMYQPQKRSSRLMQQVGHFCIFIYGPKATCSKNTRHSIETLKIR